MHEDAKRLTFFAPPGRSTAEELARQQLHVIGEPLVRQLLDGFPEPAMILNCHRQIIAANDKLVALLARDHDSLIGLRPGEAFGCVHSSDLPAGCGTTAFCRHCGAAQALLASQRDRGPDVAECRLARHVDGTTAALDLRVWATPLTVAGEHFTIFAVRDTTDEKRREILERLFFHDVLNAAGGLKTLIELWPDLRADEIAAMSDLARRLASEVVEQIQAQRDLTRAEHGDLDVHVGDVDVSALLSALCTLYMPQAVVRSARIAAPSVTGPTTVHADGVLLRRVLENLIKNAVEASHEGQTVSVTFDNRRQPVFHVHNESVMPEAVRLQVFQRSFSTKDGQGRGIGCYSAKLLVERYLGGDITFSSTPEGGTTFSVHLPACR